MPPVRRNQDSRRTARLQLSAARASGLALAGALALALGACSGSGSASEVLIHPERRYIDIVERIPTKGAAQAALERVRRRGDMHRVAIHEVFDREDPANVPPWKRAILQAIFTARPHTLVGPLPLNAKWCFFEVTRAVPAVVKRAA